MTDTNTFRRTRLKQLTALGLLGPAGIAGLIQEALAKGDVPTVSGINSLSGNVTVNGIQAKSGTVVKAGDKVSTSANSMAVVVIGKDGFLLRDSTSVTFQESKSKDLASREQYGLDESTLGFALLKRHAGAVAQ